jgi:1,4-dihydroxy-2-naphthoate octaprenyltransferase
MNTQRIITWLRAMRIQFLQASIIPVVLGSALAYRDGAFSWELFGLITIGIGAIHLGTNLTNDYFDHISGADERNSNPTPFSGGSRVIQERLISPSAIFNAAMTFYVIGVLLGVYLIFRTDWKLLWFGFFGVIFSFFYTAPPLKLGYRGWGELLVGVLLGPLAVMGAYYVYTRTLTPQVLLLSLPIGFLVSAILYINQFPDMESDAAVGKLHWIARMGRERAVKGYHLLIGAAYLSILLSVSFGILPVWSLLSFVTLPLAMQAAWILQRSYNRIPELIPAMGLTIVIHLSVGLLLFVGLILDRWTSF